MPLANFKKGGLGKRESGGFDVRRFSMPETPPQVEPTSRELYAALKKSPFFDPEDERWICEIDEAGTFINDEKYRLNQLLGLYVEALFNPAAAENRYHAAQENAALYREGFWQEASGERAQLPAQFIGIIVEALFSPITAREKFRKLKADFYAEDTQLWRPFSSGPHVSRYATSWELYAGWMEASLYPDRAAQVLTKLRQSAFYNPDYQNWRATNDPMDKDSSMLRSNHLMLEILMETYTTPESAYAHYQALKNGPLYNKDKQRWYQDYDLSSSFKIFGSQAQLLGIILEHRFEELFPEPPALATKVEPQPLTKDI